MFVKSANMHEMSMVAYFDDGKVHGNQQSPLLISGGYGACHQEALIVDNN